MCPNVLQVLTYLAGRTKELRLGSMVVVVPWHEPVRVAEELSVLDHLSGGRLLLGLGRGLGRVEFDGFRLDMGESRVRFVEYAEAIVKAFDSGVLVYDGELYRQPPVEVRPAPLASLRGRVYASAVSPASQEIMARLGFGVMVIAQKPWDTTEAEVRSYRERFVELNGAEPPRPLLVSFVAVHESEAGAEELFEQHIMANARSTVAHYEFANVNLADIPGYEYYGKLAENIGKYGVERFTRFLAELQVYGTPEQVTEELTEYVRRLDGAGVVANLSYGDMPPEVACANQELFARRVLPQLRAIDPGRDIEPVAARQGSGSVLLPSGRR
jgi:alkanesulfonate monooxygenase SsuD/methylene tetrahydromethanopterin reductase-like flavin-dependent oxidoreductase (luciferase family)